VNDANTDWVASTAIQERGVGLGRGHIAEPWGVEGIQHCLALGGIQSAGMRTPGIWLWAHQLGAALRLSAHRRSGAPLPIETGPADAEGRTRMLHTHGGGKRRSRPHQDIGCSAVGAVSPKSAETFF